MRFQRNPDLEETLLDDMLAKLDEGYVKQSPSLTDMLYCLTKAWYDNLYNAPKSRKTKLYFTIGLALEKAIVKDKVEPTTGNYDGIFYHIDSMDFEEMLELKSTRIRANKDPENLSESWLKQIMGYLKTQGRTRAKLAVIHIIEPEIAAWDLEFDQSEIDANWKWITDRRQIWNESVSSGEAPREFTYNVGTWECKGRDSQCTYLTLCEGRKAARGL